MLSDTDNIRWGLLKNAIKGMCRKKSIGFVKNSVRKPKITIDTHEKMEEKRKGKNVNAAEGQQLQLNNEVRRATDAAREQWERDVSEDRGISRWKKTALGAPEGKGKSS